MDTSSTDSSFDSVLDSSADSSFDSVLDSSADSLPDSALDSSPDSLPDSALEAVLFASGSPVSTEKLCEIFDVQKSELSLTAELLSARLGADESGISLVYIDDSYQLCTKPSYAEFVKRALDLRKTPPLTKASLEVLAIVAYNQPATRSV
ncbi:MAG: SMC-Scp complex subunit ScpB, partial [Clostridia bacterium]